MDAAQIKPSAATVRLAEEFLSGSYELIVSGWCQGVSAIDETGRPIEPASLFARKWSVAGALERIWQRSALDDDLTLDAFLLAHATLGAVVHGAPQEWNDADDRTERHALDALAEAALRIRT